MRIQIDFDKKQKSPSMFALERFLNYHLIEINHGISFDAIFITFIEKPKKDQKYKRKYLYKLYADISIDCEFENYNELSLSNFEKGFVSFQKSIEFIKEINIENRDFNESLLKTNIQDLKVLIPKNEIELNKWVGKKDEIERIIHLKRMKCKFEQRKLNQKPLNVKLKGFRIYEDSENPDLRPYLNFISVTLSEIVKKFSFFTPKYKEIYFYISKNIDEAKKVFALEDWHEYAYAVLDYDTFLNSNIKEKFVLLYKSLSIAFYELSEIDNLDNQSIATVLNELNKKIKSITEENTDSDLIEKLYLNNQKEKLLLNRK
ncbi:MAG: hypothetical protein A3G95_05750 [Flavobacteria bacterium RIFCSPLOWO2_12_FULL_31_7]|nr:MAG: hypothetical protein A3G95_05750 [Flavobacteria bacterium RIFCSPLOWO2_12_FULL_31_7]